MALAAARKNSEPWRVSVTCRWPRLSRLSRAHRMRLVILPQAVRIATPPTVGFMVQIAKNTSLASSVARQHSVTLGELIDLQNGLFSGWVSPSSALKLCQRYYAVAAIPV